MTEEASKPRAKSCVLTINGGSSSIKFALFQVEPSLQRVLEGKIERIGLPAATFVVKGSNRANNFSRPVTAPDHTAAVSALMDWIERSVGQASLIGVGHRGVHGGPRYTDTPVCTPGTIPAFCTI